MIRRSLRLSLLLATVPLEAIAAPMYRLSLLDSPAQGHYSALGNAINDRGVVAGDYDAHRSSAAVWDADGHLRRFQVFGDTVLNAFLDIDGRGDLVGYATKPGNAYVYHAFVVRDGVTTQLVPDTHSSIATAIADDGTVAGSLIESGGVAHAFAWRDGRITLLGTLGGEASSANAISRAGICGTSTINQRGNSHGFCWRDGVMSDLGGLGGMVSQVFDVNDTGVAVGQCWTIVDGRQLRHACSFHDGAVTDLGSFEPGTESTANAISADGVVVGHSQYSIPYHSRYRAAIFENGQAIELNTRVVDLPAGWSLEDASGINASGQITGDVYVGSQRERAFVLTPITQP